MICPHYTLSDYYCAACSDSNIKTNYKAKYERMLSFNIIWLDKEASKSPSDSLWITRDKIKSLLQELEEI